MDRFGVWLSAVGLLMVVAGLAWLFGAAGLISGGMIVLVAGVLTPFDRL